MYPDVGWTYGGVVHSLQVNALLIRITDHGVTEQSTLVVLAMFLKLRKPYHTAVHKECDPPHVQPMSRYHTISNSYTPFPRKTSKFHTVINSYTWKWFYYSNISIRRINQWSFVIPDGRWKVLKERQQQSDLCCQGVLLGLDCYCLSAYFHGRQQHNSKDAHKDSGHTVVITVMHWCLPRWWSCEQGS